jgi:hypothetical protein
MNALVPRSALLPLALVLCGSLLPGCRAGDFLAPGALPAGWSERSRARYDRNTLFDYIDGGAERYLGRGFRALAAARYGNAAGDEVTVDIYDMGAPANAAAVMDDTRVPHPRRLTLGDAAVAHDYGVHCRRGPRYVEVSVPRIDPALATAAEAVARAACVPAR